MARTGHCDFRVIGAFDTETCNVFTGGAWHAYPILYQVNDLRNTTIADYTPDVSDDIRLYTTADEFCAWIRSVIAWAAEQPFVPILAIYNLTFDIQTIIAQFPDYDMQTMAQSSASIYTWDLVDRVSGVPVFRFWDVQKLQTAGLAVMGELAGFPKAVGDWDYDLVRIPNVTPLSDAEQGYARRDVQVIPAYLKYLLQSNSWLEESMFGSTVITATSLVRQYAKRNIGVFRSGKWSLLDKQKFTCDADTPKDYETYAERAAAFRGGLSFTSAATAGMVVHNVASLDVTSMHHTFMPAFVPVGFSKADVETLTRAAHMVLEIPRWAVLASYHKPFDAAFHMRVRFRNIRLRKGSCFDRWGIALLAHAKFVQKVDFAGLERDEAYQAAENVVRESGYHDSYAPDTVFAFGKLYASSCVDVFVTEIELWAISQVYEWDSMEPLSGEVTYKFVEAPPFVGFQSQQLYAMKSQVKRLLNSYHEGTPYEGEIGNLIPPTMVSEAREGTLAVSTIDSYYKFTKGMFNAIYGTQAQNVFKPDYVIDGEYDVRVNAETTPTEANFDTLEPRSTTVLYTYGMRIVGRSRLHLILAMELLDEALGSRVDVTGGDTDSLKVRCDADVSNDELLRALAPLHKAADECLHVGYFKARKAFPTLACDMAGVGHFDVEKCGKEPEGEAPCYRYPSHVEWWVKCRVSFDKWGHAHVTCAGLPCPKRPSWETREFPWNIEEWYEHSASVRGVDAALMSGIGYNVTVPYSICHYLQHTRPSKLSWFDGDITDYRGVTAHVHAPEAIALYPQSRLLGGPDCGDNLDNIRYLSRVYGRKVNTAPKVLGAIKAEEWTW